jgi:predicted DNA-binding transcriptional regulator AlpA
MSEYHFSLTMIGELDDATLDAFYEAGCGDGTFSTDGALVFVEFDRGAMTLLDAIVSAIAQVESVPGIEVLNVEPDELVWASEIAERMGRSRQSIDMLIKGQRGPGDFPSPASHATRNPLWRWLEVESWFETYEGRPADRERSSIIGGVNGALQARRAVRSAEHSVPLRRAVRQLLAS